MENQKPLLGASEIHNTHCTHSQTATERLSGLGLQLKAEKDDEEPRVHPRFVQLWTTVPETTAEDTERTCPTSRNTAVFSTGASRDNLHAVETQMELYELEQINANDQMTSAVVDSVPAFSHGPPASVEKRFSCSYCEKSFSRFSQLKEHLRCHTGEKPFACAQCGRSFTKHCNLTRHMHQRIHTGEKPYRCTTCGKNFSQQSNLRTHQKTHCKTRTHT
uniref:C2H2-type domain-containing protein n=1 Tax=Sinocyclocheilus rhinocerous TaxID=307959 RepID=A0A673H611_9TELE